jgi:hypothetical protein
MWCVSSNREYFASQGKAKLCLDILGQFEFFTEAESPKTNLGNNTQCLNTLLHKDSNDVY